MLIKLLNEGLDPIDAEGAEFEFGYGLDGAEPNARVNYAETVRACGRHIVTCQMLLEGPVDRAEAVLRNSIQWCEFWALRAPTPELREMFTKSLRRLVEGPTAEE